MSTHVSSWAWRQDVKNPRHKLLLVKLADSANDDGVTWPSLRTLAHETGISKSALGRTARALEEAGLLGIRETTKADGSRGAHVYTLASPPKEGVPPRRDTPVSHPKRDTVSHPGRDRTVREPSKDKKDLADARASAPPEHLGGSRWRIASTRVGKGPFTADVAAGTCTCENRHPTKCRHLRSAEVAAERREKARKRELRDAVWDELVDLFGAPAERQRTSFGAARTSIVELLVGAGVEETLEAWRAEVKRRHAALAAEWGLGKVTLAAFVQNFGLAGKLGEGKAHPNGNGKKGVGAQDIYDYARQLEEEGR